MKIKIIVKAKKELIKKKVMKILIKKIMLLVRKKVLKLLSRKQEIEIGLLIKKR